MSFMERFKEIGKDDGRGGKVVKSRERMFCIEMNNERKGTGEVRTKYRVI